MRVNDKSHTAPEGNFSTIIKERKRPDYKMREFRLFDIMPHMKELDIGRNAQLFIISIIAHYSEKQRSKGKFMDDFKLTDEGDVIYKVTISEKEIEEKFGFCKDTLIKIKQELRKSGIVEIDFIREISKEKKYSRYKNHSWAEKYVNREEQYSLIINLIYS